MFKHPAIQLAYFDESGDEQPLQGSEDLLVFALTAVIVDESRVAALQKDFLDLKRRLVPTRDRSKLAASDLVRSERKGRYLRRALRTDKRGSRRLAIAFLDAFMKLLELHGVRVAVAFRLKGSSKLSRNLYAESVTELLTTINSYAGRKSTRFLAVLDSRTHAKNAPTVAYVFDQMLDPFNSLPQLVEPPFFGHSDSHILLQLADILASGLVAPMLSYAAGKGQPHSPFGDFEVLAERYGDRIQALEINPVTRELTF